MQVVKENLGNVKNESEQLSESIDTMFGAFSNSISRQRLEAYRTKNSDDLDVLTDCLWNTALCEAFYPSLQFLEVGLRNSIHQALTFTTRDEKWFKSSVMCDRSREDVQKAEKHLQENQKDHNDPNRMVAELGFGFWTRLFNRHYQQQLWNNKTFLLRAFPNATQVQRSRNTFAPRIDGIRRFRNRVFHHERIIGHDLSKLHREIVETTGWISKELVQGSSVIDRFKLIHKIEFREQLKASISTFCPTTAKE